jgi:hypothetical protein
MICATLGREKRSLRTPLRVPAQRESEKTRRCAVISVGVRNGDCRFLRCERLTWVLREVGGGLRVDIGSVFVIQTRQKS